MNILGKYCPIQEFSHCNDLCAWWNSKYQCCAVVAIADRLTEEYSPTFCQMCKNYRNDGTCAKGAAVCESDNMLKYCEYYNEKER